MKYADLSTILKQEIRKCVESQYASFAPEAHPPLAEIRLEVPALPQFGEFSSNIAMVLAKQLKKSPAIIAKEIKEKLKKSPEFEKYFEAVVPEKSAYINFFIKPEIFPKLVQEIADDSGFGQSKKE